ncbi:MAG: tryptophan--tRNA ligase [Candidatus Taylorbacteria bacterium]|nr:tryptophan--tRNA ligase [Candidatus Taylorbacteria bacterium]
MIKVFSGIRPSGKLHLGNYLGAIKNWIELQNADPLTRLRTSQAIFAVVDYHGITTPYDPKTYQKQIMDVVLDYLAAGVDPKKSLLIRQSKVTQHTELTWLFNTITPVSWLDRLPTYKEQLEKTKSNNAGLLDYPVLMAADILIYKSNLVPVGEDQMPHIDLANEIAKKFNSMFGQTFEPIKPHISKGARIMSLQDPAKKMSKTGDEGIALSDEPDIVMAKIKKATTDSGKEIKYDEKEKPGISNLLTIYSLLSKKDIKDIEKEYSGKSYVDFKNDLAEVVVNFLKPFQEKRKELEKNMDEVVKILTKSEESAKLIASSTMKEVKERMGLE